MWVTRCSELTAALLLSMLLSSCDGHSKCDTVVDAQVIHCQGNEAPGALDATTDATLLTPSSDGASADSGDAALPLQVLGYDFVLVNATAAPLYVQESDFPGGNAFLELRAAGPLQFERSCSICSCDACSTCGVCGRSVARVRRIEAGASHSARWAGNIWEQVALSCGSLPMCQRRTGAPTGELTAIVTYSDGFDVTAEFGADDQFVRKPTRSASAKFFYVDGARTTIELR